MIVGTVVFGVGGVGRGMRGGGGRWNWTAVVDAAATSVPTTSIVTATSVVIAAAMGSIILADIARNKVAQ